MGSSLHLPGVGLRPGLVGRRTLGAILERDRQRTADTRWAQMVRSIGNGLHIVKDFCNDAEYVVGSAQGSLSYRPGQVVALMSSTGTPGEVIVAQPPPGRAGASAFPVALSTRSTRFAVTAPSNCPAPILGRSYLGVIDDGGADTLRAYLYTDGTFVSVAGTKSYAGLLSTIDLNTCHRVHPSGDLLVFKARQSGADRIVTWNVAAGTLAIVSQSGVTDISGPVWNGASDLYFTETYLDFLSDDQVIQLRKCAVGASGALDYEASKVGDPIQDALLSSPDILCYTGSTWEKPSFDDPGSDEVACPYFDGSAWADGRGRVLANPANPGAASDGYPVTGGRAARVMFFPSSNRTIGLLPPGPSSPEIALIPDAWGFGPFGHSVSPSGAHLSLYPVELSGDEPPNDKLMRIPVAGVTYPDDCELHRIPVEPGPEGLPHVMLCRD